ncbi:MAG: SAM-dependent methyltransferase [Pseudonocardiales bacterium]|nr:SAM-dependent methyltransferase [Pseudonocardiales bacterium]MBV9729497.1 SAM-dependent methyltransferase [Pseudonocardiales bacterium]
MEKPSWASDDLDIERPSPARVYDYYLGGSHNFVVDRRMARQAIDLWPELPLIMQANRAFLRRSVRYLVRQGITQFLDIGSGIPTEGNVHEVAQAASPQSRVVYVDIDPVAVAHSRAMLPGNSRADIIQADLRDVAAIFNDPRTRRLLDLGQPIGVLMVAMLHFVPDEADPASIIARYRKMMVPGSYLVVSHATHEGSPDQAGPHTELYRRAGAPLIMRSRLEVEALFDGFDLVSPGVVFLPLWRPDSPADVDDHPERFAAFAAVGRRE